MQRSDKGLRKGFAGKCVNQTVGQLKQTNMVILAGTQNEANTISTINITQTRIDNPNTNTALRTK